MIAVFYLCQRHVSTASAGLPPGRSLFSFLGSATPTYLHGSKTKTPSHYMACYISLFASNSLALFLWVAVVLFCPDATRWFMWIKREYGNMSGPMCMAEVGPAVVSWTTRW